MVRALIGSNLGKIYARKNTSAKEMVVTIAICNTFTLAAAFLSLPTISKMLSMHEAFAERNNIKFPCNKRRLAPAKIDDKAAQTSETGS